MNSKLPIFNGKETRRVWDEKKKKSVVTGENFLGNVKSSNKLNGH